MSCTVTNTDSVCSPDSEGTLEGNTLSIQTNSSDSKDSLDVKTNVDSTDVSQTTESEPPKPLSMAFTIDFGGGKIDKQRLEHLAKQSQARQQRIQSTSGSVSRTSPVNDASVFKPPLSSKLPRKTQGYNSEGYFSSDQEDSILSGSVKLRESHLAQNKSQNVPKSPTLFDKTKIKSPTASFSGKRVSKSPIVDSIMSRSDILPSKQNLNLPLKQTTASSFKTVHRTPSFGTIPTKYSRTPDTQMLTDISSPELDMLTPDVTSPVHKTHKIPLSPIKKVDYDNMFKKCSSKTELYIGDDDSDNSSTGTYTIEGDNYTEEQKARMSIDKKYAAELLGEGDMRKYKSSDERDPELIMDYPDVIKPRSREVLTPNRSSPRKENVLEVTCWHDNPTDDLAAQTSKQIKSTRNYLEKIKSRVKNMSERIQKSPPKPDDVGSFTSITTCGVLSLKHPKRTEPMRHCSLAKSQIDQTDYVHRLSRESSVPVCLPSESRQTNFDSTLRPSRDLEGYSSSALRSAIRNLEDDKVVGLSYLSLNRCKGDKTWIQEWAESVKNYNTKASAREHVESDLNTTFSVPDDERALSPRLECAKMQSSTPTKIPSPVATHHYRNQPTIPSNQETESYLLKTQNAITNLQSKLQCSRPSSGGSKLPLSNLTRSNSLNYRLRHREQENYKNNESEKTTFSNEKTTFPSEKTTFSSEKLAFLNETPKKRDANFNSPNYISNSSEEIPLLPKKTHVRHRSFDGRNSKHFNTEFNPNMTISLKSVLKNNAFDSIYPRIDQTKFNCKIAMEKTPLNKHDSYKNQSKVTNAYSPNSHTIKRSSSFNTVNLNNNLKSPNFGSRRSSEVSEIDCLSDVSDTDFKYAAFKFRGVVPSNSPRCPNTPEPLRKFGTVKKNENRIEPVNKPKNIQNTRMVKSRSSTRENTPKPLDNKGPKAPSNRAPPQPVKDQEFCKWKKRSSYDPMKSAQEGKKRQQAKKSGSNKDDNSPPSESTAWSADPMISSVQSDTGVLYRDIRMRDPFHNNYMQDNPSQNNMYRELDKRKTFIIDDDVTTRDNIEMRKATSRGDQETIDKRKTFIIESDTNSTVSGRNSSVFSVTPSSDTEPESEPIIMREKSKTANASNRHSGDFSTQREGSAGKQRVQPRYLDISKYKSETSPRNFLRRDPSRTYVSVLPPAPDRPQTAAPKVDLELKKQELEKWKRRASYDPRKAAAQAKTKPGTPKTNSSVLRSQSFHSGVRALEQANNSVLSPIDRHY